MAEPNILLDALIDEAGLSHAGLAARVNASCGTSYDHASVARWIRDHAIPRGRVPDLICDLLSERLGRLLTLADIGMELRTDEQDDDMSLSRVVDRAAALWRSDGRQRAPGRAARVLDGPAAIAPLFEWENPPDDANLSGPGADRVSAADVRMLRDARQRYEQMYRRVGGVPVRPRVVHLLAEVVAPKLRGCYSDELGRQLFRAAGGLAALAGVCAYDADLHALSQRYEFTALRMAKASGDRAFGAYVVALLTNQAMQLGRYRLVLQYAETALRAGRGHITPALETDLHSLQAKAYARMGMRSGAHKHVRRSEETSGRINPADEPPELGYVQPGLVETQAAEALRRLGDLSAAQTYAEESLRTGAEIHLRGQVHRHAGLALILAERGEIESSVDVATQMLDRVQGMESWRLHERVLSVRDTLHQRGRGSAAVRAFRERVDDQIRVPL